MVLFAAMPGRLRPVKPVLCRKAGFFARENTPPGADVLADTAIQARWRCGLT